MSDMLRYDVLLVIYRIVAYLAVAHHHQPSLLIIAISYRHQPLPLAISHQPSVIAVAIIIWTIGWIS